MREVCFVNKGENVQKIGYSLGLTGKKECAHERILGYKYIEIEAGSDDITIVRNYHSYNLKRVEIGESILDIYAQGYEVVGGEIFESGDVLILKRPMGIRYNVKPLETLDDISQKFGIDINEIIQNNNLSTDKLFVGQILII